MLENKNVLIGYSGHAYVVADSHISNGNSLHYYTELSEVDNNPFNLEYLGFESDIKFKGWQKKMNFILGIGDNKLREAVANLILSKAQEIISVIDSNSKLSKNSNFGIGIFVSKGALVNAFSKIGDFSILNTGCIVEHECEIGTASHIGPGAVLCGNVKVGKRTFIGANSVIKQGVVIGDDVIIGAGSVILNNIESNSKVVGNPGKLIF